MNLITMWSQKRDEIEKEFDLESPNFDGNPKKLTKREIAGLISEEDNLIDAHSLANITRKDLIIIWNIYSELGYLWSLLSEEEEDWLLEKGYGFNPHNRGIVFKNPEDQWMEAQNQEED